MILVPIINTMTIYDYQEQQKKKAIQEAILLYLAILILLFLSRLK